MKEFWNKYKFVVIIAIAVILLFTGTLVYYRYKVYTLKQELFDTKIKYVLEVDSLRTEMIHERIRLTDSILSIEQEKYEALLFQFKQQKKEYEKIYSDYSDIVIERPEY